MSSFRSFRNWTSDEIWRVYQSLKWDWSAWKNSTQLSRGTCRNTRRLNWDLVHQTYDNLGTPWKPSILLKSRWRSTSEQSFMMESQSLVLQIWRLKDTVRLSSVFFKKAVMAVKKKLWQWCSQFPDFPTWPAGFSQPGSLSMAMWNNQRVWHASKKQDDERLASTMSWFQPKTSRVPKIRFGALATRCSLFSCYNSKESLRPITPISPQHE